MIEKRGSHKQVSSVVTLTTLQHKGVHNLLAHIYLIKYSWTVFAQPQNRDLLLGNTFITALRGKQYPYQQTIFLLQYKRPTFFMYNTKTTQARYKDNQIRSKKCSYQQDYIIPRWLPLQHASPSIDHCSYVLRCKNNPCLPRSEIANVRIVTSRMDK